MSIDAVISGRIRGPVTVKTAVNGNTYAQFRLSAADKNGESLLCGCIAFTDSAIDAVKRLADGDAVAIAGEVAISAWRGKDGIERHGLDVLVHGAVSPYHAGRKRGDKPAAGGDL